MGALTVAHVVDSLALGGAERMAVELANGLAGRGVRTTLIATRRAGPLAAEVHPAVELVDIGRKRRWDLDGMLRVANALNRRQVDIVHSHGRTSMQLVSLLRALRLAKARHVFHDHNPLGQPGRLPIRLGVDAYIGVDQRLVDRARKTPKVLVRNAIDMARFDDATPLDVRTEFGLEHCGAIVAVVANVHARKDHLTLVKALAQAPDRTLGALLIGETDSDPDNVARVNKEIARHNLQDRVRLTGPRPDVPAILKGSDIGVLSSTAETGPLAVAEYLAAGLPAISTDTGELITALRDNITVVPIGDAAALAEAINDLAARTPQQRQAIGAKGQAAARAVLSLDAAVDQVLALYRELSLRR